MNQALSFSNRYVRIGLVALILLFLLMLLLAPATGQKTSGSTYNRAPEGYLGWYEYMAAQGTPVQRWRRPLSDLLERPSDQPQTILRIYPGIVSIYQAGNSEWVADWLAAGNHLIALGIEAPVTEAPFTSAPESAFGPVVIKTRRRYEAATEGNRAVLTDEFGAMVWQRDESEAAGKFYVALTPHLAANAYLDAPGNFAFLADLATQAGGTIWADEYLHGYKEADAVVTEETRNWIDYLARTPIKIAFIQIAILLGIVLISQNRRLGNLVPVQTPKVDNSRVYIEALAAVLHKAESTAFLVDMITKAERSRLQKALGFNEATVDDANLQQAWTQQTQQPAESLTPLLQPPTSVSKSVNQTLRNWLAQLAQLRQTPIR